jgi:hypothetical protein
MVQVVYLILGLFLSLTNCLNVREQPTFILLLVTHFPSLHFLLFLCYHKSDITSLIVPPYHLIILAPRDCII